MLGAVQSMILRDMVLFRLLSPRIWTRTAQADDYHKLYFEILQAVCGHRNFLNPWPVDYKGLETIHF